MDGSSGGPAILQICEDGKVRAREDWREALEKVRELGEKQEAHGQQVVNYEIRRAALRGREKVVAD